jgi:hypothetical protein
MMRIAALFLASAMVASNALGAPPKQSWSHARFLLEQFARCTATTKRALATQAIVEDWPMKVMADRRFIGSDCGNHDYLFSPLMALKAAIGEQLLLTDKEELDPGSVAKSPPLVFRAPSNAESMKDSEREVIEHEEITLAMTRLGECVIRADPAGSRALLGTKLASANERQRARSLTGAISSCVSKGKTLELNVENVRQMIGLAYYRMMVAVRSAPPAPTDQVRDD